MPDSLVALALRIGAPTVPDSETDPETVPYPAIVALALEVASPGLPPKTPPRVGPMSSQGVAPAMQL